MPAVPSRRTAIVVGAAFLVALLIGGTAWRMTGQGSSAPPGFSIGGPFTLTDSAGHTVTDRDLRGRYLLVYFGYTFCPDVCPTTLSEVATALDKLGSKADRLQPVFITVDPERDSPAVMRDYTAAFSPRLLGLTGTPAEIQAVAKEYRVFYQKHRTGEGPQDYSMDHSSLLYLMGPDGRFVAPIRADESGEAMAKDIAGHLE